MKSRAQVTGPIIKLLSEPDFCTEFPGNPLMIQEYAMFGSPFYLVRIDSGGIRSKTCANNDITSSFVPTFRIWIEENID